jgi:hypothetical protein
MTEMERPRCELCGEEDASMKMQEAAVCDDCFANECRDRLMPVLGRRR